jgi:hypothetical protein
MSEFFCLNYVVGAWEEIHIVLGQFIDIPAHRVVDDIIHYRGCIVVAPEPPLRDMIVRVMRDPPSTRNFRYSCEYESPQVTRIISREVFRLHILLGYIHDDRDCIFHGTVWHELNKSIGT